MKKNFLFAALVAAFLSVANYAAAQVTIGGSTPPKAGAILDLNSATKGGLALSNVDLAESIVNLTDLNVIPVGFPGINSPGDVNDEVKAKLTGAIVYNSNPAICLGVYVWNGKQWLKVDKDYQVKAAKVATLDIPAISDTDKDFIPENQELTFEVGTPGDAQYYHWYADNTYLTTTTTQEYITSAFSSLGSHTMKVVLDNCLSLSEPNAVPFMVRVSPATIKANTSEYIRIYGNNIFTYAATSEYVQQDYLAAHYDGINNEGNGDEYHNFSATTWTDLSGKGNHLTNNNGAGKFNVTGYIFNGTGNHWKKAPPLAGIPTGNNDFSVEMRYKFAGTYTTVATCVVSWGRLVSCQGFSLGFRRQDVFTHVFLNNDIDIPFSGAQTTPNTLTTTYTAETGNESTARKVYVNTTPTSYVSCSFVCQWGKPVFDGDKPLIIGGGPEGDNYDNHTNLNLQSVRVYNKALSQDEINANFAVDEKRFIKLPTVTVGGQSCTDVAILSPHILTCKAPQISTPGEVVVTVTGDGVSSPLNLNHGELKYVP